VQDANRNAAHARVPGHASVPRVGFQGEPGAFSEEALLTLFPNAVPVPHRTFRDVTDAVERGEDDAGLLPVENTLAGGVAAAFDALYGAELHAVREVVIPIRLCLLAPPGAHLDQIREVRSHPVALAQCERFFAAHRDLVPVSVHDTAGAARQVREAGVPSLGAIAPRHAADRYGLAVLAENLQDRDDNQTRFLLVVPGRAPDHPTTSTGVRLKTALIVEAENRPGALHALLGIIAARSLDLTFIESRPAGTPWTYRFILEFRHETYEEARACLEEVARVSRAVRNVGTYVAHSPAERGLAGR
jgi:prephenate dehydratase